MEGVGRIRNLGIGLSQLPRVGVEHQPDRLFESLGVHETSIRGSGFDGGHSYTNGERNPDRRDGPVGSMKSPAPGFKTT